MIVLRTFLKIDFSRDGCDSPVLELSGMTSIQWFCVGAFHSREKTSVLEAFNYL